MDAEILTCLFSFQGCHDSWSYIFRYGKFELLDLYVEFNQSSKGVVYPSSNCAKFHWPKIYLEYLINNNL